MVSVSVEVDASGLAALAARVTRKLRRLPRSMAKVAKSGAASLRRGDPYQNRTGEARANTVGRLAGDGAVLEMDVPYAIYLQRRGFTNFEGVAEDVYEQIIELSHDAVR